jgi:hypothetical protein
MGLSLVVRVSPITAPEGGRVKRLTMARKLARSAWELFVGVGV